MTAKERQYLEQIGKKVFLLRQTKGWTQAQLAEKMGTKDAQVRRIEKGQANSSILMLVKIANALEVAIDKLVK